MFRDRLGAAWPCYAGWTTTWPDLAVAGWMRWRLGMKHVASLACKARREASGRWVREVWVWAEDGWTRRFAPSIPRRSWPGLAWPGFTWLDERSQASVPAAASCIPGKRCVYTQSMLLVCSFI